MSLEEGKHISGSSAKESYSAKASIFEKLDLFCDEISSDIRSAAPTDHKLHQTLASLKEKAYLDRSPEAQFALLLYRKYKEVVSSQNYAPSSSSGDTLGTLPLWLNNRIPVGMLDGSADQLEGVSATTKNIFWLRLICCILSLISFSVMSSAPFIHYPYPTPKDMFLPTCALSNTNITGNFDFTPFQTTLAAAVLIFVHSFLFSIYYVLPVDTNGQKHIPYLERVFEPCSISSTDVHSYSSRVAIFCKARSKAIEAMADLALLAFNLIVVVIASILVERGSKFGFGVGVEVWYTIGTFYLTFEHSVPQCVGDSDPSSRIRGSLAMSYICLFFQVLTAMVSIRSFLKESRLRSSSLPLSPSDLADSQGVKRSLVRNADPEEDDGVVEVSL